MALIKVAEDKRYLTNPKGQATFILGANYQGYFDRAWQMWENNKFDPALINGDFKKMAQAGLKVVRLFVQAPLIADIQQDDFNKLDRVIQLAADNKLVVLITLNDTHALNLSHVVSLDRKIAERYQYDPAILGWDLQNEPSFWSFAAAIYPAAHPAPIQSNILVEHYGPRVSQQEAIQLQNQGYIPQHLNPAHAYYYINALKLFIEFDNDVKTWTQQNKVSLVDYMFTDESAKWRRLITVLHNTVAAWLTVRRDPIKTIDPDHLITVGYNWLHFAWLPANQVLDFHSFHKYEPATLNRLQVIATDLAGLKRVFPEQPILMSEFGYANQSNSNPATSKPVEGEVTALFETSLLAHLRSNGFAGGLKWMVNDMDNTTNPYQASFGIYKVGNHPKPIRDLLARFSREWAMPPTQGTLQMVQDPVGLAFRFDLDNKITLGGGVFQDAVFSWQAENIAYCFIEKHEDHLRINTRGGGHLIFAPWAVIPNWQTTNQSILYRVLNNKLAELATFQAGEQVAWDIVPGIIYHLAMGEPVEPLPPETPEIIPNPGEHVILLADANNTLRLSLPYIFKFIPEMTFAPDHVAGRWGYVTVVATQDQIPETTLDTIRASGAHLVERIEGDIATILGNLVAQNRRFLSTEASPPPSDSPVEAMAPPAPPTKANTYTVQPGDSLSKIALTIYQQVSLWSLIFEANQDVLINPSDLRAGMILKIPPKP